MITNKALVSQHLSMLLDTHIRLETEKAQLLDPTARLAEIATEQAALVATAQETLDRFNAIEGTSFTLAQVRARLLP